MKILATVLTREGGFELQCEAPVTTSPHAPIGLMLPGTTRHWLTIADATALRTVLQQAIHLAQAGSLQIPLEEKE
jgi:alkylhydroperoxidase/carboxymuconolactone decarboxylase family protein YurZ